MHAQADAETLNYWGRIGVRRARTARLQMSALSAYSKNSKACMCMCTQVCTCIRIILSVNAASSHSSHRKKKKDDTGKGRVGGVVTCVFRRGKAEEQLNYSLQKKRSLRPQTH